LPWAPVCIDTPLVDLLSVERVRTEKIGLDDSVDEFDSRHYNPRIKLHRVDNDIKF